jgi:uncharacterized protein (DUF2164 family)
MKKLLELPTPVRAQAIDSLKRYSEENLPEPLGDLPAGLLLDYFLEEIGPLVYNRAIADAQARLQTRVADLNGELFEDEFGYWPRQDARRKAKR